MGNCRVGAPAWIDAVAKMAERHAARLPLNMSRDNGKKRKNAKPDEVLRIGPIV